MPLVVGNGADLFRPVAVQRVQGSDAGMRRDAPLARSRRQALFTLLVLDLYYIERKESIYILFIFFGENNLEISTVVKSKMKNPMRMLFHYVTGHIRNI